MFATGAINGHEAPPIVNNGVMFVVDAGQPGDRARREDRRRCCGAIGGRCPRTSIVLHPTNRGVALYGDKVFFAAGEARARRARRAHRQGGVDRRRSPTTSSGYYMTLAPLVADGKVMVGASGGEFGIRGFVAAYDAETGKEVWRTYTVPAPGEPGSETWPKGDQWKTGGAPVWVTGNYDPETEPRLLGHRQRRAVDGRSAARRQPLHRVDDRHRRRDRRRSRATSSTTRTNRGTGTRCRRRSSSTTSATAARSRD